MSEDIRRDGDPGEGGEVPVPRFSARSYRADGASYRGEEPPYGVPLRLRVGPYVEDETGAMSAGRAAAMRMARSASLDNSPLPPSYRARQSYRMDTPDDEIVYASRSHRSMLGSSFRAPAAGEEGLEDEKSFRTVEDKHMMINQLFGMRPRLAVPTAVKEEPAEPASPTFWSSMVDSGIMGKVANYIWVIFAGWWLCGLYMLVGGIMYLTGVGKAYGDYCFRVRRYILWPFGRYFILHDPSVPVEGAPSDPTKSSALLREKPNLSGEKLPASGRILWFIFATLLLSPFHVIVGFACWLVIVLAPMAKMNFAFLQVTYSQDVRYLDFDEDPPSSEQEVVFHTHSAGDKGALSQQIVGINIVMANLLFVVILCICLHYVIPPLFGVEEPHFLILFVLSTVSIIPISYYIGMAIASLSVQSNFAAGAVLNASFGSFIELMLYFSAMRAGSLNELVQASVTGTLLGMMLLLPGLAMIAGGIKYKQQRFNRAATGVSSVLLSISIVGAFTPTIFYSTYGSYVLGCEDCVSGIDNTTEMRCAGCTWSEGELTLDHIFLDAVKPLTMFCAIILPLGYLAGVFFTLKTHSHIYDEPLDDDHEGGGGHEGPGWSKGFSIAVLLVSAGMFGLISEELVHSLTPVLRMFDIPPRFAGLTFIALVTSTIEFLNAILFAYHNDLTLALEIANSYCVQVALIQMPALVFIALGVNYYEPQNLPFTLVFPNLDLFAVILGLMILNFTSAEGKANYFAGISLVFIYSLFIAAFYFVPSPGWEQIGRAHV